MDPVLEKNAGKVSKTIWKGIGEALKIMGKYPKTTLGVIAGTAGTLALANRLHPLHQMVREETKHRVLTDQTKILKDILRSNIKKPVKPTGRKMLIQPLT